jgi:hypothetical protein
VAAYENLLRKIILRAPNAALMSFAVYAWKIDEVGDEPPYTSVPNPFWNTGELNNAAVAAAAAAAQQHAWSHCTPECHTPFGVLVSTVAVVLMVHGFEAAIPAATATAAEAAAAASRVVEMLVSGLQCYQGCKTLQHKQQQQQQMQQEMSIPGMSPFEACTSRCLVRC